MRQPIDLWGQRGWHGQEVAGESNYVEAIRKVLGNHTGRDWVEVTAVAQLVPEPNNRYDANAVQVLINGSVVGYLPREDAARYAPVLSPLVASGWLPQVSAQVRGAMVEDYDDSRGRERTTTKFVGNVRLDLAEPHLLVPANAAPDDPHVVLPHGNAIQVTGEEAYLSTLAPLVGQAGETWIHVTLHEVAEQAARSVKTLVEVRVNGLPGGRLTPKMSGELLPAIRHFTDAGLLTAGRAILKGNQLKADITLYVARSGELAHDFLSQATSGPRPAVTTPPVIPGQLVASDHHSTSPAAITAANASWRFNPPPGWPPAPDGWVPPDGWTPPSNLPPAPAGWQWWVRAS
jgi:collagen type III alpha